MVTIEEFVQLAPFTTFGIGGPARYFARAKTIEDLEEAQKFAADKGIPIFILGGGSNVLIADAGIPGLGVKMELMGIEIHLIKESPLSTLLVAAAGERWDAVVERAIAEEIWGIENLSGIPGTFGGAVVQNIGAYGQAISERLEWVEVWDMTKRELKRLSTEECCFDYRDSIFKHERAWIVLRAAIKLSKDAKPNLSYRDLKQSFEGKNPTLQEIHTAVLAIRKQKFPDLALEGTAGSFFKNPMLPRAEAEALREKYPDMPLFDMPETTAVKVPLAWLLDHVLNIKGHSVGGARLFERQPLVIAAAPGTSSSQVKKLAEIVRMKVRDAFGFEIEEEVKIIQNVNPKMENDNIKL